MKKSRKSASVLKYEENQDVSPKLIAKGKGIVADHILKEAVKHEIPVRKDPSLTELLSQLEINQLIPEELYQAVAEVFAFIYKVDHKTSK
ncbi:EscU/YscU/HrcU family type III secretion system export apparatus switch protein [Bacillus sp. FJAT-27986]|uniref:EscU/YscU/HrcU family type III secretion system export apparatus switch protein n=1 Tax=Bacillus sp. FJAT-27986 TaxID=1743146 RepID=UPI00080AE508|nr:EscU/YscU/HrcU family type III secretion system export apparatus switch protein [Bacillus sp. FJAT-27986]OCA89642.1 type III secretion system protein [Bacillus sp. FJAT-27986]